MKSKFIKLFVLTLLCAILVLCLVACADKTNDNTNGDTPKPSLLDFEGITFVNKTVAYSGTQQEITVDGAPEGATVTYTNNKGTKPGEYKATAVIKKDGYNTKTLNATLKINMPTAKQVVDARQNYLDSNTVGYDFYLNLNGNISFAGHSGEANANYEGSYRYNKETGEIQFKRTTSGMLLYDAIEYIYTEGDTKIKVKANEDGVAKRLSVMTNDEEGLMLINLPFESLVNALGEDNLVNIQMTSNKDFMFKANIQLATGNALLDKILGVIGNMSAKLEIKNVEFANPVNGLEIFFNLDSSMSLADYAFSTTVSFPIKGVKASLSLSYGQTSNGNTIKIPSVEGLSTSKSDITKELNVINSALNAVKNSSTYSLDLSAENQFDPGWNVTATTDKFISRLYKNTYDLDGGSFVAFNNSFEYKTHHEEDGKETYKYTIGNVTSDGAVYEISRKGGNQQTLLQNVTANTRFDYMTSAFILDSADVDCIRKVVKDGSTFYYISLNGSEAVNVQEKINGYINSNEAEGVVKVDNYFNKNDNTLADAEMVVEIKNGKVVEITTKTEITYVPTGGDYIDRVITLTDSLTLTVNENLDKATEYEAPKNVSTSLTGLGLNNTKFYIL